MKATDLPEVTEPDKCVYCKHLRHMTGKCEAIECECPYGGIPEEILAIHQQASTTGNDVDPNGVDHPAHYNLHPSGVECIAVVRHHNFNVGSAIKYLWRQGLKDGEPSIKDLSKAIWYIEDEIKRLETLEAPGEGEHS